MKFDQRIERTLKSKLFFVLCLLHSLGTVLLLVDGNVSVLDILMAVFLWLVQIAAARDIIDPAYMRRVSGVIFAEYILNFVLAGLLVELGALAAILFSLAGTNEKLAEMFDELFATLLPSVPQPTDELAALFPVVTLAVCVVLAGVLVLFNQLYTRKLHRLVQSCYRRMEDPQADVKKVPAVRKWLMVTGTIIAIEAVSTLGEAEVFRFLGYGAHSAACIVGGIMIGRYLEKDA